MTASASERDGFELVRDANAELLRRFDEYRDAGDDSVRQNIVDEACEAIEIHLRTVEAVLLPAIDGVAAGTEDAGAIVRGQTEHEILQLMMEGLRSRYIDEPGAQDLLAGLEEHLRVYVAFVEDRALTLLEPRVSAAKLASAWQKAVVDATRSAREGL